MMAIHELLVRAAERWPNRRAVQGQGASRTFADLLDRSQRLAGSLRTLGVGSGDRVAVCLGNRVEALEVAMACSFLGGIFVPLNPLLRMRQLTHVLQDSGAMILVTSPIATLSIEELAKSSPSLQHAVVCDGNAVLDRRHHGVASHRLEELVQCGEAVRGAAAAPRQAAAIYYTSGSSGAAKGVVVSHHALVCGAECVAGYLKMTADDRILCVLPFSFDYGFNQLLTSVFSGCLAIVTTFSTATALVSEAALEGVTGLAGVPAMWSQLARCNWPRDLQRSLRYITNSGGVLTEPVLEKLRSVLPSTDIYCMYGLTEAFRSTFLEPSLIDARKGSVGKAVPTQEIYVVRPDGTHCDAGECGELVHRGSFVALGYWNDPDLSAKRFRPARQCVAAAREGELAVWSGDLVFRDAEGFIYFVSRMDEQLKVSGYRVSPVEIEGVIAELDFIVDVAVIARSPAGEPQLVAFVVLSEQAAGSAEAVRRHCRAQLPPYMVPAEVQVLEMLPRNANGKCDKQALRKLSP